MNFNWTNMLQFHYISVYIFICYNQIYIYIHNTIYWMFEILYHTLEYNFSTSPKIQSYRCRILFFRLILSPFWLSISRRKRWHRGCRSNASDIVNVACKPFLRDDTIRCMQYIFASYKYETIHATRKLESTQILFLRIT